MKKKLVKVALFTTESAPHLDFFLENIKEKNLSLEIKLIFSLKENANFQTLENKLGIKYLTTDNFSRKDLLGLGIELIILSDFDYQRIIDLELLEVYKDRILDVFPALLPAFEDKKASRNQIIQAVLARKVQITGCTVYKVTEKLCQGEILAQSVLEIEAEESFSTLEQKLKKEEELLYAYALVEYLKRLPDFSPTLTNFITSENKTKTRGKELSYKKHTIEFFYESDKLAKAGFAVSNIGLRREKDADAVILSSDLRVAGVADGIGSAKHGAQTSEKIAEFFHKQWNFTNQNKKIRGINHGIWLKQAVIECNKRLLKWQKNSIEKIDVGSTLVVSLFDPEKEELYISNTGDSRAYLWRKNILFRLTYDHSENFDVDSGEGDSLLLYMGGKACFFGLDLYLLKIFPGDLIMFCSDGALFSSEELIAQRFSQIQNQLEQTQTKIRDLANQIIKDNYQVGAPDNISVTLMQF